MKHLQYTLPLMIFLSLTLLTSGQNLSADDIMQNYKEHEHTNDSNVNLNMSLISENGSSREREVVWYSKTDNNDNKKQLIRYLSPADVKGTGFLAIENENGEDDNWLYLPVLRKVRRISAADKTDNFMGTEFTYEDLEDEDLDDYSYSLKGTGKINDIDTYVIEAVPASADKKENSGYGKRELWISKDKFIVLQIKFYDRNGGLIKIFNAEDIRQIPGSNKWRTYKLTMKNIQNNKSTILEFSDYKINTGIDDSFFTKRYLKRVN